jgi:hypothetical protein
MKSRGRGDFYSGSGGLSLWDLGRQPRKQELWRLLL